MKRQLVLSACLVSLALITSTAQAKGCLKGAAVGGVAGHLAGHGVIGAAGGCVVGRHQANKKDKAAAEQQKSESTSQQSPAQTTPAPASN